VTGTNSSRDWNRSRPIWRAPAQGRSGTLSVIRCGRRRLFARRRTETENPKTFRLRRRRGVARQTVSRILPCYNAGESNRGGAVPPKADDQRKTNMILLSSVSTFIKASPPSGISLRCRRMVWRWHQGILRRDRADLSRIGDTARLAARCRGDRRSLTTRGAWAGASGFLRRAS
jgi:hypothetical protein